MLIPKLAHGDFSGRNVVVPTPSLKVCSSALFVFVSSAFRHFSLPTSRILGVIFGFGRLELSPPQTI
ncbi:unnamed protein product [Caenorhabditis auriculariae]|uniref:Uncharacterized protein n=1 Tax=Caenorhabditis auriculariae TaxID=2777116 RepID=A0A8S1H8K2_9PELO|nr:unnamed protein product [Caenorhabditis auriculariae]